MDDLPPPPASVVRPPVLKWTLQLTALVLVAGLVLGGVILLSQHAREQIRERERFQTAFADIDCNPPAPLERAEFLEEVLYHSRQPERFSTLDDSLVERLNAAFLQHPWVAKVDKVDVTPPRGVRVTLIYRQPALAVAVASDLAGTTPKLRAVDEQGILLPKKVPIPGDLIVLHGAPRPASAAGKPWGDPGVAAAAQTVVLLKPQLGKSGITAMSLTPQGLMLWSSHVKVIWGLTSSKGDEATFVEKERRLGEVLAKPQSMSWWSPWMHEIDLRPREGIKSRLVPWESPAAVNSTKKD